MFWVYTGLTVDHDWRLLVLAGGVCLLAGTSAIGLFRRAKGKLRQQGMLLDAAVENMSQGLCMFDADGRIVLCNDRYAKMMGSAAASLKGVSLLDLLLKYRKTVGERADDAEEFFARLLVDVREGKSSTKVVKTSAGRTLRVHDQPMKKGGGWVSTFEDITEWREAQDQIAYMAHHDALTGLANRTQLMEKLHDALAAHALQQGSVAVHFIDLDRFKNVNDTLGHDGGDFLLKTVAERLRSVTGANDVVARLGGDEFVIVQTDIRGDDEAEDLAHRLTAVVTAPMELSEQTIIATMSVGIALATDATNSEQLLKNADLALYRAKADGRNCIRFFQPEMDAELQARFKLERLIRDAVQHDRFELHYQPLYEMSERRLIGFEALIRLPGEDGRLIPPLEFIPVAEDLRLIDRIGAWVLREACRTAATWPENLTVAVNLSPAQFLAGGVSDVVAAALKEAGLAAHRLELEITETLLLGSTETTMSELRALKAMGVAIVMDDFGTGYSSLSYLWRFPFDKIKIDRSFMQGFEGSARDARTVVKTIIALGRELNMRVTVEGVETAAQAAFLDSADGDQAQGYFFGYPIPAAELGAKILAHFQKTQLASSSAAATNDKLRLIKSSG